MSEINRQKNIAQFVDQEAKHDNGNTPYILQFALRDSIHEEEFRQTIFDFYGSRVDWPENLTPYPKVYSVTIHSKDYQTACSTPLEQDDEF